LANVVQYSVGSILESSLLSITAGPGGALWFPAGNTMAELIPGSQPGQANIVKYALKHGAILGKWQSLGAERSFLSYPTSDESAANGGRYSTFQGGVVYWSPATGAHEVHAAILAKWLSLGAERSFLGFATSD